jgi:hypothetical protein
MTAIDLAAALRGLKFDEERLIDVHAKARMRFFLCSETERNDGLLRMYFPAGAVPPALPQGDDCAAWVALLQDISTDVDGILASYLAPALHCNNYLEWLAQDIEWEEKKYDLSPDTPHPSNILRRASAAAYGASTLVALKSALDRLMLVLHYFYAGIARHTTWGHCSENGKWSGFMALVESSKQRDALLASVSEAYNRWIKGAVGPRDALIHYRDADSVWHFISDHQALMQTSIVVGPDAREHRFGAGTLTFYVREWYEFFEATLLGLALRLPRPPRRS